MRSILLSTTVFAITIVLFNSCKTKEGPKVLPTVSTTTISDITDTSATIHGNVADAGSSALVKVGVCWALATGPTLLDSHMVSGAVKGDFEFNAKGFKNNTTYYARAFAANDGGITYGNELTFKTTPGWLAITPANVSFVSCVLALNGNALIIGTSLGIYKSQNNGTTWAPANNGLTNLKVNCLTTNGSAIFAGTDGGVFRSYDAGGTWFAVNTNLGTLNVNVLATNGATICAGTTNGVYTSSVSGDSWNQASNLPGFTNVTLLTIFANRIFAGSTSAKSIYWTDDGGLNWSKISKDFSSEAPSCVFADPPVLLVTTEIGLYYSHDQGSTLEKVPGLNAAMYCVNVSNNSIFAGGQGKVESLYQSKDLGTNYTLTENPGDNNTFTVVSIAANNAFVFGVSANKLYRMRS